MTAGPAVHRQTSSGRYHPLLGTNVEVRVDALAGSDDEAERLGARTQGPAVPVAGWSDRRGVGGAAGLPRSGGALVEGVRRRLPPGGGSPAGALAQGRGHG